MALIFGLTIFTVAGCKDSGRRDDKPRGEPRDASGKRDDPSMQTLADGRKTFRFETFGNEEYWTGTAKLHSVIQQSVTPAMALRVGLKIDAAAIPADVAAGIRNGTVDLNSTATTIALLKLDAVVGLKGTVREVDGKDSLVRVGITCALCHSTVDNSFSPGIGHRKDGWANRDLNVGAIIALSPAITPEQKLVYNSWGPGKYDPRYNIDGMNTPLVIPPVYGLAQTRNATFTAEGSMSYWNAYVAVTQMHGQGNFSEPRLGINVRNSPPDLVDPKLPALRNYQHSLETPRPRANNTDNATIRSGRTVFNDNCARCHVDSKGTDNNDGILHAPSETGMDPKYAMRTANKKYRTTPLRGLWQHPPYFHDGSAESLSDVVEHYNRTLKLRLTNTQKTDLIEYLKTL
ncbi:MAG: c-type cytochrome [Planctomycetota bacterium]